MGDQAHEPVISAELAEEPSAIDRMEADIDQIRGLADVMKPCSRQEDVSSHTADRGQPRCLGSHGLDVLLPTG